VNKSTGDAHWEHEMTISIENTQGAIEARCGLRIDILGKWSDHPSLVAQRPSRVVSCGVRLDDSEWPVRVTARPLVSVEIRWRSLDLGFDRRLCYPDMLANPLVATLLSRYPATSQHGLEVLLAQKGGIYLETESRVPFQSGMGASSALVACCLAALQHLDGRVADFPHLAEASYRIESGLHMTGWQDHYAVVIGGPILVTRASSDTHARVQPIVPRLSEIITRHGLVFFWSDQGRRPMPWTGEMGNVLQKVTEMDEIVSQLLDTEKNIDISHLLNIIEHHTRIERQVWPCDAWQEIRHRLGLSSRRVAAWVVGAGPAVCVLSETPRSAVERSFEQALGRRAHRIFPA
jgi:galactokinase/mevalonate kinase-like predicted kinase